MRFISKGVPTPRKVIEEELLPRWKKLEQTDPACGFWAVDSELDEFLGWFHLKPDRLVPEDLELGYRLHRKVWGRGLATEGARALIAHGFSRTHCPRISATTLEGNLASRRVMEKCGLRLERHFVYAMELLPTWSDPERRAVRYVIDRPPG